jgi:hypothetical protein
MIAEPLQADRQARWTAFPTDPSWAFVPEALGDTPYVAASETIELTQ